MAWETGTAAGHKDLLAKLKTFALMHGWTLERYLTPLDGEHELWLSSTGLSGQESIKVGYQTTSSDSNDTFNLKLKVSVLFSSGSSFDTMPNSSGTKYIYLWQNPITYYFLINQDRIVILAQVSTKTQLSYSGKLRTYCSLGHWPRQVVVFGTSNHDSGRWSSEGADYSNFQSLNSRNNEYLWVDNTFKVSNRSFPRQTTLPILTGELVTPPSERWMLQMFCIHDERGAIGEFQGCFYIVGRNTSTGQKFSSPDGLREFVVVQNVHRTGFADYIALELK
ncbi:hypothetical protein VO418_001701 [Vibrio cholerae]|nr:hypothetical protein [Vibrio cholerae]EMC9386116.1 hypothetical protein [Vibrio cholerae]